MNRQDRRNAVDPGDVNGIFTARTEFYRTEIYKLLKGLFKIKAPLEWEKDYILNTLMQKGFFLLANTPAGVIPCKGSLHGINYWDYPTKATINMPGMQTIECTLHEDCEVFFLERTRYRSFYTFNKLVDVYAYKLAAADAGIDVNLMNCRVAYIIEAESKGQAETIKQIYQDITEGKPIVVYRNNVIDKNGLQLIFGNVKNTYVADLIQDSKRTIVNELLTAVGINNANTDKRERLVNSEVNANNIELQANTALWKSNLKLSRKRAKKIFPDIDFSIKLRFDAKKIAQFSSAVEQEWSPVEQKRSANETNRSGGNMESGKGK